MSGYRAAKVAAVDEDVKGYTATIVTYGVVDDYRTKWRPGVFTRALNEWMPVNTWGHNWQLPIGQMDDVVYDGDDRTDAHFRLDLAMIPGTDRPAVPKAHEAAALLRSGTLRSVSVGFSKEKSLIDPEDDIPEFIEADLDEVGLVLRGAVPGAEVTGLRSRGMRVSIAEVAELARQIERGELTESEAQRALRLLYGGDATVPAADSPEQLAGPDPELAEALAEADLLLG